MKSSFTSLTPGTHRTSGRRSTHLRIVLLLLIVCCPALAQERVGIRVANNTVLVPARINHRDLTFVLDTGSEFSAIDSSIAQQLGLTGTAAIPVLKNYREQGSEMVEVRSLGIGSRVFTHKTFGTVELNHISAAIGAHVDGILGNDILQSTPFQLNYSKRELKIGPFANVARLGKLIRLRRDGDEFYIPLQIVSVPVELLLDTGTNSTNLSSQTWQSVSRVWQPRSVIDGVVRAGSASRRHSWFASPVFRWQTRPSPVRSCACNARSIPAFSLERASVESSDPTFCVSLKLPWISHTAVSF